MEILGWLLIAGLPFAVVLDSNGEVERQLRDLFSTKDLVAALEAVAEDTD